MNIKNTIIGGAASAMMLGASVLPAFAADFFQGFETDTSGWFDNGGTITRVASGANGITSADGSFHAEVEEGVFTRWGGYENTFPTDGYVTQVDVYVDMAENLTVGTDKRLDFSSAINQPDGNHRRDFIFHLGTDPATADQWVASVSNNAPGWPANPARSPIAITETGWYTLQSTFQDNGSGVLEVVMEILDDTDTVVGSWTLSDPSDVIGTTVGGNRYGWFVTNDFVTLAIDNSAKTDVVVVERSAEITSPTAGETVSGEVDFTAFLTDDDADAIQWAVREGTCAAGTNTVFGNVDGHSDSADIDPTDLSNQTFSFTGDMSTMGSGSYCFIYNPVEDSGESPIRETVEFTLQKATPTDKNECKDGGWETFTSPTFRNQGQCVSYVQSNENAGKRN